MNQYARLDFCRSSEVVREGRSDVRMTIIRMLMMVAIAGVVVLAIVAGAAGRAFQDDVCLSGSARGRLDDGDCLARNRDRASAADQRGRGGLFRSRHGSERRADCDPATPDLQAALTFLRWGNDPVAQVSHGRCSATGRGSDACRSRDAAWSAAAVQKPASETAMGGRHRAVPREGEVVCNLEAIAPCLWGLNVAVVAVVSIVCTAQK